MMKHSDNKILIDQAKQGDAGAFTEIVNRYRHAVYGYCYSRTYRFEDAQDLCQEVFIRAYTKLDQLEQPEKLGAWLKKVAINLCNRWASRHIEVPVDTVYLSDPPRKSESEILVHEALQNLPDNERLAVVMHYVDGLSYTDIAQFLEVSTGAVRGRLHRGRERLRTEVIKMTQEEFKNNRLDEHFTVETVELARSFTRLGLGWSPDGKYILCSRRFDNGVQLWITEPAGRNAHPVSDIGWQEDYGWSPDGKKLVFGYASARDITLPGSIHVYDVETGKTREIASGFTWNQFENWTGWAKPVWTHDSRQFALLMNRTNEDVPRADANVFDAETGVMTVMAPNLYTVGLSHPGDWSLDNSKFYLAARPKEGDTHSIWVCNRDSSDLHQLTPDELVITYDPRVRPVGEWIAFATTNGRTEEEKQQCTGDIWMMKPDGSGIRTLTQGSNPDPTKRVSYRDPEWSSDGRYLVCLTHRFDKAKNMYDGARAVDVETGEIIVLMETDPESGQYITGFRDKTTISPDGKRVAFVVAQYTLENRDSEKPIYKDRRDIVYWYDLAARTLHEVTRSSPDEDGKVFFAGGYNWRPAWSPDSRKLLFTCGKVIEPAKPLSPEEGPRVVRALGSAFDRLQPQTDTRLCIADIG